MVSSCTLKYFMSRENRNRAGRVDDESTAFQWEDDTEIGIAVAEAVGAVTDVDPINLEPRVSDVVDPDALDRTLRSAPPGASFALPFGDYLVTVWSDGKLVVTETG